MSELEGIVVDPKQVMLIQKERIVGELSQEAEIIGFQVEADLDEITRLYAAERGSRQQAEDAKKTKEMIEADLLVREIDKGKEGKINGSNEKTRELQIRVFLGNMNGEYKDACEGLAQAERRWWADKSEIDLAEKKLSAHMGFLRLATAKLNAIGG